MPQTKAVFFDVFNTLIDLTTDEENPQAYTFLSRWLSYQGFEIAPDAFHHLYKQLAAAEIRANPHAHPDIEIGNVFHGILSTVNADRLQAMGEDVVRELALLFRILTTRHINVIPETSAALRALGQHVQVGIISNTQRLFTLPELAKFQLREHVDQIVFSSDMLASKPNPRIFQRALNGLAIKPDEAIMIGDNLFDDVWGAQQVGMRAVWFDREYPVTLPDGIEHPTPDAQFRQGSSVTLYDMLVDML